MSTKLKRVGIIGAGKLGVTLAQLALSAGYEVYIAGSGDAEEIWLSTQIVTPGAVAVAVEEAVEVADIVILALPLGQFRTLDPTLFRGKLVLDGMNHWFEVDGPRSDIMPDNQPTTSAVKQHLAGARVVKAFNHMGYHHLRDEARPHGEPDRKAIAFASDDESLVEIVARFIDDLGFDPLFLGGLEVSRVLETGHPAFGAHLTAAELARVVGVTPKSTDKIGLE